MKNDRDFYFSSMRKENHFDKRCSYHSCTIILSPLHDKCGNKDKTGALPSKSYSLMILPGIFTGIDLRGKDCLLSSPPAASPYFTVK